MTIKNFKLIRFPEKNLTRGVLFCNDEYICDTLEDQVRDFNADGDLQDDGESKVYGETAIPYGEYKLIVTYSPRFKKDMVLICDVPEFTGVRMHWGRTEKQSKGCVLVGKRNGDTLDNIGMTDKMADLVKNNECYIKII